MRRLGEREAQALMVFLFHIVSWCTSIGKKEQCSQEWRRWKSDETISRIAPRPSLDGVVDEGGKAVAGEHKFHAVHCEESRQGLW